MLDDNSMCFGNLLAILHPYLYKDSSDKQVSTVLLYATYSLMIVWIMCACSRKYNSGQERCVMLAITKNVSTAFLSQLSDIKKAFVSNIGTLFSF